MPSDIGSDSGRTFLRVLSETPDELIQTSKGKFLVSKLGVEQYDERVKGDRTLTMALMKM